MGMTMTQKILASHAGLDSVAAGQLIEARLDLVLGNDVTTPVAINEFNKIGCKTVFDRTKSPSFRIILPPTRTSKRPNRQSLYASSRANMKSSIISKSAAWASNMRSFRKKGSSSPATS